MTTPADAVVAGAVAQFRDDPRLQQHDLLQVQQPHGRVEGVEAELDGGGQLQSFRSIISLKASALYAFSIETRLG